jgi:tetratricopeptide (TPR) repeat protein
MSTSLFQEAKTLVAQGSDSQAKDKYSELILYCQNLLDSDGAQNGSELKETLALAYNNRGHLRYLSVDFDEAIEDYTKALEYNQKLAVAFYNRGQIHYRLGHFEQSVHDMSKAVALDENFMDAKTFLTQSEKNLRKMAAVGD